MKGIEDSLVAYAYRDGAYILSPVDFSMYRPKHKKVYNEFYINSDKEIVYKKFEKTN